MGQLIPTIPPHHSPPLVVCLALLFALGLAACSPFTPGDPPVADSTFRRVLVELHLTTARSEHQDTIPKGLPDSILRRYDVRREDFDATLRHYSRHPDAFESLYDGVIDTLNALQNRIRQIQSPSQSPIPDSIQKQRGMDVNNP